MNKLGVYKNFIDALTVIAVVCVGLMLYSYHQGAVDSRARIEKAMDAKVAARPDKYGETNHEAFVAELKQWGIVPREFPSKALTQPTTQP